MESNDRRVVILLCVIIAILSILCALFATDVLTLNVNKKVTKESEKVEDKSKPDTKSDIIVFLTKALNDEDWVKSNLYAKKNCFGDDVSDKKQNLTFVVLSDKNNNPFVIVYNYSLDYHVSVAYRINVENGSIVVENISGNIENPAHVTFSVDKQRKLVISEYLHMGEYSFNAYDVAGEDITKYDEYTCEDCDGYAGKKEYSKSSIDLELNQENISSYLTKAL